MGRNPGAGVGRALKLGRLVCRPAVRPREFDDHHAAAILVTCRGQGNVFPMADSDIRSYTFGTLVTAMVTPFTADGEVDYQKSAELASKLVDDGNDDGGAGEEGGRRSESVVAGAVALGAAAIEGGVGDDGHFRLEAGERFQIGPSSKFSPAVFGLKCGMCMPLGTKKKPSRIGGLLPVTARMLVWLMASSQGREMATPRPRRIVRREIGSWSLVFLLTGGPFSERVAFDDRINQ